MIDKSTKKIIQIRMDSGITGAQRSLKVPLSKNLVEDVAIIFIMVKMRII